ncbi:MAG TPA: hypothetical protein VNZ64_05860 [Candidatus Acidoferrum sp.]|jgi:hypothetical protein|nr:hypothetical protein [Candidatus Acidoferrum sp.]
MEKNIAIKMISTAGLVLGLSAGSVIGQQNLIVNGSFESGPAGVQKFPGWDLIGPAGNNSDYGVAQSGANPDVAEQGNLYAYFHGNPTDGSQDCLGQTLHLTVGAQYIISYYLATDGTTLGSGAAMYVVIGNSFGIDYSYDLPLTSYLPNSSTAMPYQKFATTITATNSSEILSFHGFDATSAILLDNVSMTLVGPQLNLSLSPTNTLVFTWSFPTAGYRLQANASLGTTNWVALTNTPVTAGSSNRLILPVPASNVFYRLTQP